MYDPASEAWREWRLPGPGLQPYAVYVDDQDKVWLSDFGANALVRFDPETERFTRSPLPSERRTCARSWDAPARCGAPSPPPTPSSSSGAVKPRHTRVERPTRAF